MQQGGCSTAFSSFHHTGQGHSGRSYCMLTHEVAVCSERSLCTLWICQQADWFVSCIPTVRLATSHCLVHCIALVRSLQSPGFVPQVEKMRLSNINRRNLLRKLEHTLRQKEKLADGDILKEGDQSIEGLTEKRGLVQLDDGRRRD